MPGIGYDSMLALGIRSSDQALALDSASSDAWMSRGYLSAYRDPRTLAGMREAFERAIAHDPRNVEAYHQLGAKLPLLGEDSAAAVAMARALALDPDRAITLRNMGLLEARRRRFPEAIRWLDSAVTVDPGAVYARRDRALLRLTLGDTAGARLDIAAASSAIVPGLEQWGPALQAALVAAEGDPAAAHRETERIARELDDGRNHSFELTYLAVAFLKAGDPVRALDALETFRPTAAVLWAELRLPWLEIGRAHV